MDQIEKNKLTWTLDESLGFVIIRAARSMKRGLDARLARHNLTASQYVLLVRLWEEDGIPITTLGDRLYWDNPTLTGVVDRLERDALLERRRDGSDRRVVNVYLTEKGRELRQHVDSPAESTDNLAWGTFTAEERKDLIDGLNRIWKRMDESLN